MNKAAPVAFANMPPVTTRHKLANALLRWWRRDRLAADGFRYVIFHHSPAIEPSEANAAYFTQVPITHEDDLLTVYTLDDLRAHPPCSPPGN